MAYPKHAEEAAAKQGTVSTKEFTQALKDASALVGEEIVLSAVPPARIAKMLKRFQTLTESSARLRTARKIQKVTKDHIAARGRKGLAAPGAGTRLIGDANKRVAKELRRAAEARVSKKGK
jgi:hypothetical protein